MHKPINDLKPEDALSLFVRIRNTVLGEEKPDAFTRWVFFTELFCWVLLAFWNAISYFVLLSADFIEQNKGLSVRAILIRNGQNLGFDGPEFVSIIHHFYFYSFFIWFFILFGIVLLYRKSTYSPLFLLGGLIFLFSYMFSTIGFQYFIEDISLFDKILFATMIVLSFVHSYIIKTKKIQEGKVKDMQDVDERGNLSINDDNYF